MLIAIVIYRENPSPFSEKTTGYGPQYMYTLFSGM
jgi:hypothetical protein